MGHDVVGHEAFQTADAHGFALDAADALGFALALLGADAAADGGQVVGGFDDGRGLGEFAFGDLGYEFGDADVDRAAGNAGLLDAAHAALGFVDGHLRGVAQSDFLEVMGADLGILLRDGVFGHSHIGGHYLAPPIRHSCFFMLSFSSAMYIRPRRMARSKST